MSEATVGDKARSHAGSSRAVNASSESTVTVQIKKGTAAGIYKVIDARNRPPVNGFLGLHKSAQRRMNPNSHHPGWRNLGRTNDTVDTALFGTPAALDVWMEEVTQAGISAVVANGRHQFGNEVMGSVTAEEMLDLQKRYPKRCWALAPVNLEQDIGLSIAEVKTSLEAGLLGANLEPGYRTNGGPLCVNDPILFPFYEFMQSAGKPVQVQTGIYAGPRIEYSRMETFDDLLSKFPGLKVVLGHGGYPYVADFLGCAHKHRNLFINPDVYMFAPGAELYLSGIQRLPEQILFGTAHPLSSINETLAATLEFPLDKSTMENYLYNNAARVFGI